MWVNVGGKGVFRGLAVCAMDVKSRVTVPSHYRKLLAEESEGKLVVTIDTEELCLLLYPLPRWLVIEASLEQLPSFQPATRRIQRLLIGHATDLEIDRQGRILLPSFLRHYAGLEKSVVLVGQGKRIEIWSESHWQFSRSNWLAKGVDGVTSVPQELQSFSL